MAPALRMICSPSTEKYSPALSTKTPVAFLPSKIILCAVQSDLMVRFRRWRLWLK